MIFFIYIDLYNRWFLFVEFGVGVGIGLDGVLGFGFLVISFFVDIIFYFGFFSVGVGYFDDYGFDGGLGYMRCYRGIYILFGYLFV